MIIHSVHDSIMQLDKLESHLLDCEHKIDDNRSEIEAQKQKTQEIQKSNEELQKSRIHAEEYKSFFHHKINDNITLLHYVNQDINKIAKSVFKNKKGRELDKKIIEYDESLAQLRDEIYERAARSRDR